MGRQNTKLESEGAEFLVLGSLLIKGILAYKAYVNFPNFDLIATSIETKKVARIQVKSRWATDYDKTFPLKSTDCDFVVHVALNRGYRFGKKSKNCDESVKAPIFYIFPIETLLEARAEKGWNKVKISKILDLDIYLNNWNLIKIFLGEK